MIKLLVIDKHPVVITGIKAFFKDSGNIKVVGNLAKGQAVFDYVKRRQVDIILTEIDLEDINGITLVKQLKSKHPEIKSIVYTNQPEGIYANSAYQAGASGFVNKTYTLKALNQAIIKVFNKGLYINKALTNLIKHEGDSSNTNSFTQLSPRELEVLKLISEGKRNIFIAEHLSISEKTVSTYKTRLMKKLNVSNLVELIEKAKQEF